jgi:hypothetical protein
MPFRSRSVTTIIALVFATLFFVASAGEKTSLWKIQETLAAKTYVDLTHEFESGIPHWPGFPDEGRKTIYWYDKRPDTMGSGFFSEVFTQRWPVGNECRSAGSFHQRTAHGGSNRS